MHYFSNSSKLPKTFTLTSGPVMIPSVQNLTFTQPTTPLTTPPSKKTPSPFSAESTLQRADATYPHKSIDLLTISTQNQAVIQNLIEELATSSIFHLAYNGIRLMQTGIALREAVHPYRFYAEILSNPSSRGHFQKIYEERNQFFSGRSQIWNDFYLNAGRTFQVYSDEIDCYTESFAASLQLDSFQIKAHLEQQDWESLLSLFLTSPVK